MLRSFQTLQQVVDTVHVLPCEGAVRLVGIDGPGGSGKSTLAEKLSKHLTDGVVIHMDDFYLPSPERQNVPVGQKSVGSDFDWKRLLRQVIEPLRRGEEGAYQRYDWASDQLAEWHRVPANGTVIVEGVYALRLELADNYDVTVWVECPREKRLSRGLERDGQEARDMWVNKWMVAEDLYIKEHKPRERARLVINGDG